MHCGHSKPYRWLLRFGIKPETDEHSQSILYQQAANHIIRGQRGRSVKKPPSKNDLRERLQRQTAAFYPLAARLKS